RGQVDITVKQKQQAVMLLNLFTHSNYYGSSGYTIHQLFFGKAFEVFGQTLFQSIKNVDEGVKLFERIKFEAPMHSIYAVAPTKTYHSDDDKQSQYDAEEPGAFESNGTTSPLFNTEEVSAEKEFFKKIIDWQIENEVVLNKARSEGLSHLFSFVFNKVFNRLHLMREQSTFIKSSSYGSESKEYFSDNLYHVSRRFQFVVLTAIGSFLKDKGPVVQQNTGMTPNSDRFMAPSAKSIDRAYQVNVDAFLLGEETQNRLLMEAIVKHPIFSIYDGYDYKDQTMRGWLLVGSNFQGGFRSKLRSKTRATRIVEVDDEKITKIAQKKNTENSVDHIPNIAAMNTSMQLMKALKNEPKIFLNKVKREQLELVYENSFEEGVVFIELILSMNKNATNNKKIKELGVLRQRFIDELKVNKK
ncbi:MAG: hypothetical protein HRU20_23290, partial [Pseudomonadales bacterium]|nr:hypothetical protein [Pseudomonadales bacterium]